MEKINKDITFLFVSGFLTLLYLVFIISFQIRTDNNQDKLTESLSQRVTELQKQVSELQSETFICKK